MPINFTHVSPSGVGDYACCPLKLVLDSEQGRGSADDPYKSHKDFGTVAHFATQVTLGATPTPPRPSDAIVVSARAAPGVPSTPSYFEAHVQKLATKTAEGLRAASNVQPNQFWIAEHHAADPSLLPTRLGRNSGLVEGYGGSVDLLLNDRSQLWDLKFVGQLPDDIKTSYLWQLGSYHFLTGVPITGIYWSTRDGRNACYLIIDWREPRIAPLAKHIRRFVEFTGHANFASLAWPVRGESCTFCAHRGDRCPAWAVPSMVNTSYNKFLPQSQGGDIDELLLEADRQRSFESAAPLFDAPVRPPPRPARFPPLRRPEPPPPEAPPPADTVLEDLFGG